MGKRTKCEYHYVRTNRGVYIGGIKNKKRNGWGIAINNNGNKYEGLFENDQKHLFGSELLCCLYSHNYKQNKKNVEENSEDEFAKGNVCLHENRYIYIGSYREGKKHGNGILIDYNTYAMCSCIFLRNEIIYKDVLFSLVNDLPCKHKKEDLCTTLCGKRRNEGEKCNFYPFRNDKIKMEEVTKGDKVKNESMKNEGVKNEGVKNEATEEENLAYHNPDTTEKNKRERDAHFIENQYKYNIFNYIHFYQQLMQKMKREDSSELFPHSKCKREVYFKNILRKKLSKSMLQNVQDKKDKNEFYLPRSKSKIPVIISKRNYQIVESANKQSEKDDNDFFLNNELQNNFENMAVKNMLMESAPKIKWVNNICNEETIEGTSFRPNETAHDITENNSETYDESLPNGSIRNDNNDTHVSVLRGIHKMNPFEKRENDLNEDVKCCNVVSRSALVAKLLDPLSNKNVIPTKGDGERGEGKESFVMGDEDSKGLHIRGKENAEHISDDDKFVNCTFSKRNVGTSTAFINIESEKQSGKTCNRSSSSACIFSFSQSRKNSKAFFFSKEMDNCVERRNVIAKRRVSTLKSGKKDDIVEINNFGYKDTGRSVNSGSSAISSDSHIRDKHNGKGCREIESNGKNDEDMQMNAHNINIGDGIPSRSSSFYKISSSNIDIGKRVDRNTTVDNVKNGERHTKEKSTYRRKKEKRKGETNIKCKIDKGTNPFLKHKNDDELKKEIECMLPKCLKKGRRRRRKCISYAQNCIYWNVFELNFFLFFIGIPKKMIEIFIRNDMDGYCLKYMENKLLKRMGIRDKMTKKYITLCVQYLLRLREKYKYKKRSKKINSQIDEKLFLLKKRELHYLNLIGRGGHSNVYRCVYGDKLLTYNDDYLYIKHSINNIALKLCNDKKYSYEFCSELEILSTLRHPNVSLFLGALKSPQGIALEYIKCGSIFDLIHKHKIKIKLKDIMKMCKDITAFMCFLHYKGILHCDLKSSNILLSTSGQIKICDFGLSVQNFYQKPKFLGIIGTYQWTAPEILRGEGYTQQADVYSFGVILWEMIHRKIPFHELKHPLDIIAYVGYAKKQLGISKDIPSPIRYILKRCLHRNKHKRKSFFFWSEYFDMFHETKVLHNARVKENMDFIFG
ncbi:tyrosine kinase-like protein [Plasmodium gonderi]|uniref:Tyrosine kinase-like protein n=1 Tax=Plasmodium gonderi TaxID=77519 RepID=A0A1Y1JFG5_PLAGO|nr:tyrosine kinase-like protein [Plasmodium gonderi]GAW79492.1 tyrosine kinase-like protein [Plasmodium gonderi]